MPDDRGREKRAQGRTGKGRLLSILSHEFSKGLQPSHSMVLLLFLR